MESEKPRVDEKTARLIEEMDKSLHNMEHSLGMDHLVVGKILDSYAQLLRQNNIRHLDALNMEARAKAIRAKHNQKEAEAQSKGLEPFVEEKKSITIGHLRLVGWFVSITVLVGLGFGALDIMNKGKHLKKIQMEEAAALAKSNQSAADNLLAKPMLKGDDSASTDTTADTSTESGSSKGDDESKIVDTKTVQVRDPQTGEVTQTETLTTTQHKMSVFELAERMMKIKKLAKDNLPIGLAAEKDKDFKKAANTYALVIKAVKEAPEQLGRPVFSEEIAQCCEGYARMAELDSQPQVAREWEQVAADVRAHL